MRDMSFDNVELTGKNQLSPADNFENSLQSQNLTLAPLYHAIAHQVAKIPGGEKLLVPSYDTISLQSLDIGQPYFSAFDSQPRTLNRTGKIALLGAGALITGGIATAIAVPVSQEIKEKNTKKDFDLYKYLAQSYGEQPVSYKDFKNGKAKEQYDQLKNLSSHDFNNIISNNFDHTLHGYNIYISLAQYFKEPYVSYEDFKNGDADSQYQKFNTNINNKDLLPDEISKIHYDGYVKLAINYGETPLSFDDFKSPDGQKAYENLAINAFFHPNDLPHSP